MNDCDNCDSYGSISPCRKCNKNPEYSDKWSKREWDEE